MSGLKKNHKRDEIIQKSRRWVVKIGSALLTQDGKGLDYKALTHWAEQIATLHRKGIEVILVSSGAVAEGMSRMGWKQRPRTLAELQAAAAIGQMGLIQAYESSFQKFGYHSAQILLTHDDLAHRQRYLNARSTLCTLLRLGTIPIVNENDTVAFEEIQFGDNDTLGALVANLIEADLFIILTDQLGLFDKDPRQYADAKLIQEAKANDERLTSFAGDSGTILGSGGMTTKITAAQRASHSACATIIASGREASILLKLHAKENHGTLLLPNKQSLAARKQWIAGHLKVKGEFYLDHGASQAIIKEGKSLLPVGITKITGGFQRGEVINCLDVNNNLIARGLTNYSTEDSHKIKGKPSCEIIHILKYVSDDELIHRDNLVLL